jgi:dTDP-4-amino-4,6-dideoxygalactose transaminase
VFGSGWYLLGNETSAFEQEYSKCIGTKHCIGVANGLDALRLTLKAYIELGEMQEGDENTVPANTFIASNLAISDNRLKFVLVEPDIRGYNIDANLIVEKITKRTKEIMLVHLNGQNAMNPEIQKLVEKYSLKLIEDNAQAIGANDRERRTGSLGHASGHSFYPGKNLGALGDREAKTTDNYRLASIIRALANYESNRKKDDFQGLNPRLDEIQSAILRGKLKRLDKNNQRPREIAQYYCENITNSEIVLPNQSFKNFVLQSLNHVWHLFVIRQAKRDMLQQYLKKSGIQTLVHCPIPPHKQLSYKKGKSTINIAQKFGGRTRNFTGESFWARGYFVSTVGRDEEVIRSYIRNQKGEDRMVDQLKLRR